VDWRTTFKKRTGKVVGRNTAILELKMLSLIMGEAVRLGHVDANPLVSLKIRKSKSAKKPELTDSEISEIHAALKSEPEWMKIAFDISLHTGCRLRETRIPLPCINFTENKITFPSPKGGEEKAFFDSNAKCTETPHRAFEARRASVHFGFSIPAVAALAAVLHQDQQAPSVLPSPAGYFRESVAPSRSAARGCHAARESRVRACPPDLPA
jgi:hypothetical protein